MSAIFWIAVIFVFFLVDITFAEVNPYVTVFFYLVAPAFVLLGLVLIPIGAILEKKYFKKTQHTHRFPIINFNDSRHQKIAYTVIAITTIFILCTVVGSYKAFEFTETPQFCGLLCHDVMEPEYTTYHNSAHSKVNCVACHVGHGPEHYVQAKARGIEQLLGLVKGDYAKPIETPIKNMRSPKETCLECHWSEKHFPAVAKEYHYFLPDETNTEWITRMMLFVGSGTERFGKNEGVHWHVSTDQKVEYIAADEKNAEIPWVRMLRADGTQTVYVNEDSDYSEGSPPQGPVRTMDCIDCHNRPAHKYRAPTVSVNRALHDGAIDRDLPFIKREAVNALAEEYESREEGEAAIRAAIESFYQKKYPEIAQEKKQSIEDSITALLVIYRDNFFPKMKASWKSYPDHGGHMNFEGCFRCHDGLHKSDNGKVITNSCTTCHAILGQGQPGAMETSGEALEFKHPEDIEGMWKEMKCTDCHGGVLV